MILAPPTFRRETSLKQPHLRLILLTDPTRRELVHALAGLIEAEVGRTRGARGMALRHALRMARSRRPEILKRLVDQLIPEWVEILEPHYEAWSEKGQKVSFGRYVSTHQDVLARQLLVLVQARVRTSKSRLARTCARFLQLDTLRPALPRFGSLVDTYLAAA
jgi:hypothetical protein